ncbi:ABC transporter permease, partial [Streptomyces sp. TRM76130]|nr:ABC transporter permease [Streptomyces sp. TRM76130]
MSTPQPPMPQAAPDRWAAPGPAYAGYTSPIPVVRASLPHAVASEWTKIRSVRSTLWTLGVFVLLVVGVGLLVGGVVARTEADTVGDHPLQ